MATTAIEWAHHTWNPFTGCDRVSPGCAHCYAAEVAEANQRKERGRAEAARTAGKKPPTMRYQNDGDPKTSGPGFGFTVHWDKLEKGYPSAKPGQRVFVNSMSDVFHEEAPDEAIDALWRAMLRRPEVNFLILTKRPERMRDWINRWDVITLPTAQNIWLGVSIENRRFVDRADILRETPAVVRFISAEPLLGDLVGVEQRDCRRCENSGSIPVNDRGEEVTPEFMTGGAGCPDCFETAQGDPGGHRLPGIDLTHIDWLIVGGESGPKHRRIDPGWVRDLRDEATRTETAFFFKQWGGRTAKAGGRELDGRTWDETPMGVAQAVAA